MKDLKNISYDNLKSLIEAYKIYLKEVDRLDSTTRGCIRLYENHDLDFLGTALIKYLDCVVGDDEVSYFVYECEFGDYRCLDGSPMSITMNEKEYLISDFDSWYSYLLEAESADN